MYLDNYLFGHDRYTGIRRRIFHLRVLSAEVQQSTQVWWIASIIVLCHSSAYIEINYLTFISLNARIMQLTQL